ncbi:putative tyrosine-protein phosphatase [Rosellinia necatrix]|uniref:protein-tyrosine-phosphatase n=1 Tax=Rosellinia necatrix TaxID=77044 RepID=A0A1W2TJU2_ROSNE|nr:putative tyrosine-protein phosphatase [Rosellinia necatrix]
MPSAAARRMYEDQLPSFMSIIDPESESIGERELVTVVEPKYMDTGSSCASGHIDRNQPTSQHLRPLSSNTHCHHDSTSTQNSESADSSPTLTTDTSSLSDPSPSSSPDSPVNLIPLSSFASSTFGELPTNMDGLQIDRSTTNNSPFHRPMTSPGPRKARNMKGLFIQPPFPTCTTTNPALVSEPSSPCFIKPKIPLPRKKPSLLSLKTDSQGLNLRPMISEVPNSPGLPPMLQRRSLKHSTSSPHMLSTIKSSTFGPSGGMTFPTVFERGTTGLSEVLRPTKLGNAGDDYGSTIMEEDSPIKPQLANRAAMDFQPFHDESENNEDQKSPGYPDGPIAIYGDNVYLYLEPTAEEAAKFDVVINVAREVHNPFAASAANSNGVNSGSSDAMAQSPIPDTAMTNDSFATAFEYPPREEPGTETPTTPKAGLWNEPEYIHMPWDHNTNIATDLMTLCDTIDKRTKEGKKVLIHCQQGASRSASLIIAYGLYQDPGLSVNDAYYSAQAKSRWISPNMRLMYCLQDFQKEVSKKRLPPRSAACPRSGRSPTKHRLTLSADAIEIKPKEPMTAPLPDEKEPAPNGSSPDRSALHTRGKSTPNIEAISPGPSSAPSSFSWSEKEEGKKPEPITRFNFGDTLAPPLIFEPQAEPSQQTTFPPRSSSFFKPPPSPGFPGQGFPGGSQHFGFQDHNMGLKRQNPFGNQEETSPPREAVSRPREVAIASALPLDDTMMSPRVETMTNNPLHDSFSELSGMKFVESPPTPTEGLFSPRETMFPRHALFPFGRPSQIADPRSPPTRGETPITRSIDDVL